jgi:glyoxylase-like metal-dependent hydrolase (beta-lactamase superfamily II)
VTLRVDHVVTHGIFSLDGQDFEVDNNIWIVGDDREVIVLDAAHDHRPIVDAIGGRAVRALVMSHGHNDHINAAGELADATGAPVWLHPDDSMLWQMEYATRRVDAPLVDGHRFTVAGDELSVIHTPGHSPGGCCVHVPSLGVLFSGDTLFNGGPGATGRSFSDYDTIVASIRARLFTLPATTVVHTGHGGSTTIGTEAAASTTW